MIILFYLESKFIFFFLIINFFFFLYEIYSKEGLEKEMGQIESDLKKLNCKNVIIDMTK